MSLQKLQLILSSFMLIRPGRYVINIILCYKQALKKQVEIRSPPDWIPSGPLCLCLTGAEYEHCSRITQTKKQGVSGQSIAANHDIKIEVFQKDFRAKTMIKEAIMENDYMKNLSPPQVRFYFF